MSRTVNNLLERILGTVFSPEEALELIAAVTQRTRQPEMRTYHNGRGAIQGTVPAIKLEDTPENRAALGLPPAQTEAGIQHDGLNAAGQYVHPAARVVRGSRLIQQ